MTKYYQIMMMGLLAFAPIAGKGAIAAQHSFPAAVEIKQQSQKAPKSSDFSQFRSRQSRCRTAEGKNASRSRQWLDAGAVANWRAGLDSQLISL